MLKKFIQGFALGYIGMLGYIWLTNFIGG